MPVGGRVGRGGEVGDEGWGIRYSIRTPSKCMNNHRVLDLRAFSSLTNVGFITVGKNGSGRILQPLTAFSLSPTNASYSE